ncbi:putative MFS family arabinose efflux permease [Humibacillus xanthopallidus]|uniref:Putative MFS family arabinose efflux permease n=1 Tax=Humibacillus xanthopallidus TaxID=412689 RepID=A0A543PVI0_9MICO|nr:MFS transporter [Humibacillus xanthopallidus]TQN48087.1 putative MFS family arabinose efflux permease [Humibacillus xanthopallidus]
MTTPSAAPGRDVSAQEEQAGVADALAHDPSGDARMPAASTGEGGLLSPALRATTIGALALVSLHAFEALALTTVMPTIARDLDGESLYAMAFTATLAAGIVSIVWSGNLADRRGPRPPLLLGLLLFALGLVGAGLAPTMPVLVAARIVQGLGAGMTSTALYVLVTRIYPPRLHTAILAGFSAAWVVPSIAGPFVAGVIAQTIGWRWVFGLAIVVLVGAALLLSRIVRGLGQEVVAVPWRWRALAASTVLAVAVLVLNLVAERLDALPVGVTVLLAVAALGVVVAALLPLLPRRTLLAGRGLPTDVLLRALAFAAFTGAEVYLPRLLTDRDGFSPSVAGVALTLTGVSWFAGSWIQGAWDTRFEIGRTAAASLGLMTVTLAALATSLWLAAPAWVVIGLFPLLGFGIGTLYPRVTAQALGRAGATEQGFVSSALQIGDSAGAATALALSAIVFAAAGSGVPAAYVAVLGAMAVPALVGWLVSHRVR